MFYCDTHKRFDKCIKKFKCGYKKYYYNLPTEECYDYYFCNFREKCQSYYNSYCEKHIKQCSSEKFCCLNRYTEISYLDLNKFVNLPPELILIIYFYYILHNKRCKEHIFKKKL